jgi:hypothetical protein
MKTKIEMSGYEIEIEMHEDSISVKAEKNDEVVEEFSLPLTESDDESDFEMEEGEMEDDEMAEGEMEEEDFDEELPMDDDGKLESFQSYIKKNAKKKVAINEAAELDAETIEMIASALGPLVVGGAAVTVNKVMSALKAGKAGKVGKKLADHLEKAGKAAGDARRGSSSKGKY